MTGPGAQPASTACPHCGVVLEPPPASSRKCPECREPLVVRTRKGTKLVFTPAGAEQYDRDRQREVAANKARRHAATIGIDDDAWQATEQQLAERFGQPPSGGDVFWSVANQAVQEAMGTSDWHRLQMLYFTMALHLRDEGRGYMHLRRESLQCAVRDHVAKAATFGRGEPVLQVTGCRADCTVCAPDDGRRFAPGELLTDDAPVPHDCDWCACGIRFDDAWLDQQRRHLFEDPPRKERPTRRGLFGRRRRA